MAKSVYDIASNKTSTSFYADVGKHSTEINDRIYISNVVPPIV